MSATTDTVRATEPAALAIGRRSAPTWWTVFVNEVHGLWIGGKAPVLLVLYSIVLGGNAFVTAFNVELSLLPPKEMVWEIFRTAVSVGTFMGMIIATDMISGERERGTLDVLLFTPTSRRQIVIGKFLAALTPWPFALVLVIPFMAVLAQGDEVLVPAIVWLAVLGTILTIAYTATGLLVSFWSNVNRTSYLVSLGIFILILVPSQLSGRAQQAAAGRFLQQLNPIAAMERFVEKILVNNRTVEEFLPMLWSPVGFSILATVLLLVYSAPNLRLEADRSMVRRPGLTLRGIALIALGVGAVAYMFLATPANATSRGSEVERVAATAVDDPLTISISASVEVVNQGDPIFFDTVVSNPTSSPAAPSVIAMNIINLDKEGDVVDPEDWSPERTQYVETLGPGESVTLEWRVNAILDGDYLVYMVALPEPAGRDATSQAVASPNIHLTVRPFNRLNPRGIAPLVIGAPLVLGLGTFLVLGIRRRETDGTWPPSGFRRPGAVGLGVVVAMIALSGLAVASQGPVGTAPPPGEAAASAEPEPEPTEPASPGPGASTGPSVAASASPAAGGETVEIAIDTSTEPEDLTWGTSTLRAPAGTTITLTLNNLTDADDEIGHNWVLVKPGQEESVLANGISAGDDRDWLDVDDPGIIAATKLIEGEDSDSVTFDAPEPGDYVFVCTFPEHYQNGMKGVLTIE